MAPTSNDQGCTVLSAPAEVPPQVAIDKVIARIKEVSTLPHIAMRVITVARDPDSGARDLRAVVESDPSLSLRVLRCVNSAASGIRTKVTNLQNAIAFLGFHQVRNLAITASIASMFKNNDAIGTYRRSELWRHMVSVGICSRLIAMRRRMPGFEEVFLAGLLHDMGVVLMDQYCHKHFRAVMTTIGEKESLCQAEQRVLGFDHTTLGRRVVEDWHFPSEICTTIRFHHMSENCRGDDLETVQCVELANVICSLKGIGSIGLRQVAFSPTVAQSLGVTKEDIKVLAADLDKELSANEQLFDLS